MSSGKTGYYQLNQWEASDRILRSEFNADNAAIDAGIHAASAAADSAASAAAGAASAAAGAASAAAGALAAANASPLKKLLQITTQSNAAQVDLSLAGITFPEYQELLLYAKYGTAANGYVYFRCNSETGTYLTRIDMDGALQSGDSALISLYSRDAISDLRGCIRRLPATTASAASQILCSFNGFNGETQVTYSMGTYTSPASLALSTLNAVASTEAGSILAGAEFTIYGVRK